MEIESAARVYASLGDPVRLRIVEELRLGDRQPGELAELVDLGSNLLAHHLGVLEKAGVIHRRASIGDRRERYVVLNPATLESLEQRPRLAAGSVLFICTHNSARSQFAQALTTEASGLVAQSAGTEPAARVHVHAVRVGLENGIDLRGRVPRRIESVRGTPDLVVTVCDSARQTEIPIPAPRLHWSVPDPVVRGGLADFRAAFTEIKERVERLVEGIGEGSQRR